MKEKFTNDTEASKVEKIDPKTSRIQKMLASIIRRERQLAYEVTEDTIAAKSAIQFVSATAIVGLQTDDDE